MALRLEAARLGDRRLRVLHPLPRVERDGARAEEPSGEEGR
jgi:hypothetical protein